MLFYRLSLPRGSLDRVAQATGEAVSLALDPAHEERFWQGIEGATRFFMGQANVQRALEKLVKTLEAQGTPYAIVGGMALNEFGYQRVTVDVDVLLTEQGLAAFKRVSLGRGYMEKFPGSSVRDTEYGVDIDVVLTGTYPGDRRPKPVAFPDPGRVAVRGARVALLPLAKLIELKLASGISAPHCLLDLADVLELIRRAGLSKDLAADLDASVREKYLELWRAAQAADSE
jgi:hypothetical protein